LPTWNVKSQNNLSEIKLGISRQEVVKKHYEIYQRPLPDWLLRHQVIPMLESAGLISQEKDPTDGRKYLIYPTPSLTNSDQNNIVSSTGG